MLDKRKAPSRARGGGLMTTDGQSIVSPEYSPTSPKTQVPFNRHLSSLLDQAIDKQEQALRLARFYYQQATKHRQLRASLEQAIFGGEQ